MKDLTGSGRVGQQGQHHADLFRASGMAAWKLRKRSTMAACFQISAVTGEVLLMP